LVDWLANRWIVPHEPTVEEISDLLAVVADGQLAMSHNAALQLATLALAAEGFRLGRERAHERAILSLRDTVGIEAKTVDLLDAVRRKRNQISYEHAGATSSAEAQELHKVMTALRGDALRWLKKRHPTLVPPDVTS
jgi:hypothetical protein